MEHGFTQNFHHKTKVLGSCNAGKPEGFKAKGNPSIQCFQASKHPSFRATGFFMYVRVAPWLMNSFACG